MKSIPENVLTLFFDTYQKQPTTIAVSDGHVKFSYAELEAASYGIARRLASLGASPGDVIPIVTQSCLQMVIGVLGILRTGATYAPLDSTQWPTSKMQATVARLHPKILLYTGKINVEFEPDVVSISVEEILGTLVDTNDSVHGAYISLPLPGGLACIIFTSGTTGEPKGVMLRHSSLHHFVTSPPFNYNVTCHDSVLLVLSCAFDACMGTMFSTLCNGGCVVIADGSNLHERVKTCTVFVGTPSILNSLVPPKSTGDYPVLNRLVVGGETPSKELLQRWTVLSKPIWIAYGPTEATCATLMSEVAFSEGIKTSDPRVLGFPIPGADISIVDANMEPIEALGEEGELLISGSGLAAGYWQNQELTASKFIEFRGVRTYMTGDYVRWTRDAQGRLTVYFCGRKDRVVKIRGFLVNLETDIDAAIAKNIPGVQAVHSYYDGTRIYTAVMPGHLDEVCLLSHLRRCLPQYMIPEKIYPLNSFPQNAYGKTDVRGLQAVLQEKLKSEATRHDGEMSKTRLGKDMIEGLNEILNSNSTHHLNPALSFIGNGIYSLTATRLCFFLRTRGYSFRPVDFLSTQSINSFFEYYRTVEPNMNSNNSIVAGDSTSTIGGHGPVPLTMQQLQLIHGTVKEPHFNIVSYILECDQRHLNRFKAAWMIIERIEPIFRTEIVATSVGQYTQQVTSKPHPSWDQRSIDKSQLEEEVFNIAACTGLGYRFTVIEFQNSNQAAIVWSIHHALMDGFSAGILLKKVAQTMRGDTVTPSIPLPTAIHSLQSALDRQNSANHTFWEEQEALVPYASADIPVGGIQSSDRTSTHRTQLVCFKDSTRDAVAQYCAEHGITPAALHYATWALIMSTYTGSENVVFGAVFSGRDSDELLADCVVGCLFNTLPLRIRVERDAASAEFTRHVYDLIQRTSKFHGSMGNSSQTRYSTALSCDAELSNQRAELGCVSSSQVVQYPDLPLLVIVREDRDVALLYKTDSFNEEIMQDLSDAYHNIFESLLATPRLSVRCVLQLKHKKARWQQILALGNFDNKESYTNSAESTLTAKFDDAASLYTSDLAIEKGEARLTYGQVRDRVDHLALVLESRVKPGDVVCVLADRSINWVISIFAVLKIAAVYCPNDLDNRSNQDKIIRLSKAKLVLFDHPNQRELLPRGKVASLCVSEILKDVRPATASAGRLSRYPKPDDAAFLVFTSGSTGEPKGILIENRSLVALQGSYNALFSSARGTRIAQFLSPGFDVAMQEITWALTSGGTLVLRKDDKNPFSHIGGVDTIMVTPSVAANLDPCDYPNLRYLHLAGEPVPQRVVKLWDTPKREIFNIYGPAEATVVTCSQRLISGEVISLGRPLPTTRLYVLNDQMELLPPYVVGNIYVAGIQVSRGYINHESATASAFLADTFVPASSTTRERMYCTGDLGHVDGSGRVYYCGRKDRQIKLRGFRTNLDDVANTAQQAMPTLKKAFVTERDGRLILWVEPETVDKVMLRDRLSTVLPAHAIPSTIVALEVLPLNPNGKVDAKTLNKNALPTRPVPFAPSLASPCLSPVEDMIADEWRSLLGLENSAMIQSHDSFSMLGGHSVLQLALAARLTRRFKVRMAVKDVICAPTLARLATSINNKLLNQSVGNDPPEALSQLGRHRLSPPELEWWHRYQSAEQPSAFNVPFVARLSPNTDLSRLRAAIESEIARHELLRSRFVACAGKGPRRVLSPDPILVRMVDDDDEETHRFNLQAFIDQPFHLSKDDLIRVVLTKSFVAISMSHMIIDLSALRQLLTTMADMYNKNSTNLPPPAQQYFDIQQWSAPVDAANTSFWRTYLAGTNPQRQRPQRSFRGSSTFTTISDTTRHKILSVVGEHHISLQQFTLSAVGLVLQALTGTTETPLTIGTPYMNRNTVDSSTNEDEKHIIGLFLEPLPIRIDWPPRSTSYTAVQLLRATKASAQAALAHAVPWPALLHSLDIPFPPLHQPVFDVVVTVHDNRSGGVDLAIPGAVTVGADAAALPVCAQGAKFSLCVELLAYSERMVVRLEYDSDILNERHARVLGDVLEVAFEGLSEGSDGNVLKREEVLERLESALRRACEGAGVSLDELPYIARTRLV